MLIHKKNAHAHNVFFGDSLCALLERMGLIKSKIVKVKSFYNYITHHLPAITEFSIFLGHPNVHTTGHITLYLSLTVQFLI